MRKQIGNVAPRSVRLSVPAMLLFSVLCSAQLPNGNSLGHIPPIEEPSTVRDTYVLGPDDVVSIRVADAENINSDRYRIENDGYLHVPMIGRIAAGGLTPQELEAELARHLKAYIQEPDVTVSIVEFRSQPVSVLGAVKTPGVQQLRGRKTLVEMLSLAGGLDPAAGGRIRITRRLSQGAIPLKNAVSDGQFSVAEVNLKEILETGKPEGNILIKPHDVISVPRAEMVYVTGQVQKSGGFVLNEHDSITVLQALSLAGGVDRTASTQNARILRRGAAADRSEIPVNVQKILDGKASDIALEPEDILFIPSSVPKKAALRALEIAIQVGTGVAIFRP
jgi:polysaccharide export outer membrane protein